MKKVSLISLAILALVAAAAGLGRPEAGAIDGLWVATVSDSEVKFRLTQFGEGDQGEWNTSMIGSGRPGELGNGDLYISFRDRYGEWTEAIHMGDRINSEHFEYCPSVSPDGKFLFFTRRDSSQDRKGDIYWMDAGIIEELRSGLNRKKGR